jgi:hypothetical protein
MSLSCHADGSMFPVLFVALELAVGTAIGHVVDWAVYVDYDPFVAYIDIVIVITN